MDINWFEIIHQVVYIVVSVTLYFVIKFLNDKGILEKIQKVKVNDDIKSVGARLAVLTVQQLYQNLDGEQKYQNAVLYLSDYLADRGIKISEAEMKILIESSLLQAKSELSKVWKETAN